MLRLLRDADLTFPIEELNTHIIVPWDQPSLRDCRNFGPSIVFATHKILPPSDHAYRGENNRAQDIDRC